MNQKKILTQFLLAIMVMTQTLTVVWANPDKTKTGFTFTSAAAAPIGTVESLNALTVNGQIKGQQEMLWNGDIVQAAANDSARVLLADIGTLTLRGGAAVRIQCDAKAGILTANILHGEINVALKAGSSAKINMGNEAFISAKGAQFRAGWREEQAVIDAPQGAILPLGNWNAGLALPVLANVNAQQTAPRRYLIKPMNLGTNTEIRARSTRNIQVRVTDENDRPVPDVPVLFLLNGGGSGASNVGSFAGQVSSQVTTNAQGVAQVQFNASNMSGNSANITASVPGTTATLEMIFQITSAPAGFWTPQNAIPIFAVVGAAVGIGIYKATNRAPLPTTPEIIRNPNGGTIIP